MDDDYILIHFSEQFASKHDLTVNQNDGAPSIMFKFDDDIIEILVKTFNTIRNQIMIKCIINDESIEEEMINLENLLSIKDLESKFIDDHPQIQISKSIQHHLKTDANMNRPIPDRDSKIWMDTIEWFFQKLKDLCLSEEGFLYKNIMPSSFDMIQSSDIDKFTSKLSNIRMYEIASEYNKLSSNQKFVRLPGPKSKNRFTAVPEDNMLLLPFMRARVFHSNQ